MQEYIEYIVNAVDGPYKLQLSVKNMGELKRDLKDVKVYRDEVINIAFYTNEDRETVKYRIKLNNVEFEKLMQWIDERLIGV